MSGSRSFLSKYDDPKYKTPSVQTVKDDYQKAVVYYDDAISDAMLVAGLIFLLVRPHRQSSTLQFTMEKKMSKAS